MIFSKGNVTAVLLALVAVAVVYRIPQARDLLTGR